MKKVLLLMTLGLFMTGLSFGQVNYNEDFDLDDNWSGGSGYIARTYTNDAINPANDHFASNDAFRESSHTHSGTYAWRLDDEAGAYLMYECTETVVGLSFHAARWDNSPKPEVSVEYSEDSGATWHFLFSFDGDAFSDDKVYQEFTEDFSGSITPDAGKTLQIRMRTTAGERMLYDNVTIEYEGAPVAGTPVFNPAAGTYANAQDVEITSSTYNSSIYYTTDGSTPDNTSTLYAAPINIATTTTLKAIAIKIGYDDSPITTGLYDIETATTVADIATLRSQPADGTTFYNLTGEAVLTFQQVYRNQKYIQDATAAILIDDAPDGAYNPGHITSTYNLYDGLTGIVGTLSEYQGMLQFIPNADPGAATSTGNTITPVVLTLNDINTNFDAYEAQLVQVANISFIDGGANFANGTEYEIANGGVSSYFRTTFYNVDYTGTAIPHDANVVGLMNENSAGQFITSRFLADITPATPPPSVPLGSTGIMIAGLLLVAVVVVRKGKII